MEECAYGGIVFREDDHVLMHSPIGHWGGYIWTFAKGGRDPGDPSREDAALREVLEETGHVCEVVADIPGAFESDTCVTKYYLMKPTGVVQPFDRETSEVRWVSTAQAFELISLTKTEKGRMRDTDALRSAIEVWKQINGEMPDSVLI